MLTDGAPRPGALLNRVVDSLRQLIGSQSAAALPVLLCPSPARYHLRRWLEPSLPRLTVLSPAEIPSDVRLRSAGVVR
jgi:flagellar biosynthesis protein FlhA